MSEFFECLLRETKGNREWYPRLQLGSQVANQSLKKQLSLSVIGLLAVSSIAQANQPGDTLQFVGSGANGACAVEIRIGSGHILYVHEELLDNVKLFTTFNSDRHFANDSEALGIPKIMVMKKSLLGARHFIYEYNHSNPGGLQHAHHFGISVTLGALAR
jgi:hypothetical protein